MAIIGWSILVVIVYVLLLIAVLIVVDSFIKAMKRKVPSLQTITRACLNCGRVITGEAKFCPYCGKKL